jgi:hypothetical protein
MYSKLGIALNVRDGVLPINGLRHPQNADTNGWYIWAGETFSTEADFFEPLQFIARVEVISKWGLRVRRHLSWNQWLRTTGGHFSQVK